MDSGTAMVARPLPAPPAPSEPAPTKPAAVDRWRQIRKPALAGVLVLALAGASFGAVKALSGDGNAEATPSPKRQPLNLHLRLLAAFAVPALGDIDQNKAKAR